MSAGIAETAGTITCAPVWVSQAQHWDQVAVTITTPGSSNLQIALYAGGLDATTHKMQPEGAAIVSSSNIADTAATTVTWSFTSQAVGPGLLFLCENYGDSTLF